MAEENYLGRIEISPNAIASLAGQAVLESYGVVGMANKNLRDGIVEVLGRGNYRRGIDVKVIDREIIRKLEHLSKTYDLNPAGEGGEMETTVIDAPFFEKRIEILDYEVSYRDNSGVFRIKNARLVEK